MRSFLAGLVACSLAAVAEAAAQSVPRYSLRITLRPEASHLEASGSLRLPPRAEPRDRIRLRLAASMTELAVSVTEPAECAGPARLLSKEEREGTIIYTFGLPKSLEAQRALGLQVSYGGGEKASFVFNLGPVASFADGTNTAWYPQLDGEDRRGVGRLSFLVPAGYSVIATGSASEAESRERTFRVSAPANFAFACARYGVVRRGGLVPVEAWLLDRDRDVSAHIEGLSKTMARLVEEFGPYPYDTFAIVEVPDELAAGFAGASTPGFILAVSGSLAGPFNLAYWAHELSHQWWGNLVTLEGEEHGRMMIDEALAQYGALVAIDSIEGRGAGEKLRRGTYGTGQGALEYMKMSAAGLDHRLADLPPGVVSHELADNKGFLVYDVLARTIGRELFRSILKGIAARHAFGSVSWESFLHEIEAGAFRDLGWFNEQWLERTGLPDFQLEWSQGGGSLRVVVSQAPPFYRAELELVARGEGCERVARRLTLDQARTEVAIPLSFRATTVELDPEFTVPRWTPEYREQAEALAPVVQASYARVSGKLDEAMTEFEDARRKIPSPDPHGFEFLVEVGLARILAGRGDWAGAKSHLLAALASPTRDPEVLPVVYLRLVTAAQNLGDRDLVIAAARGAVSADAMLSTPTGVGESARRLLNEKAH
jgi:hypothetical protein